MVMPKIVLAALTAEGETVIESTEYIERGYEGFEEKLRGLGAVMTKTDGNNEKAVKKFKLRVS